MKCSITLHCAPVSISCLDATGLAVSTCAASGCIAGEVNESHAVTLVAAAVKLMHCWRCGAAQRCALGWVRDMEDLWDAGLQ